MFQKLYEPHSALKEFVNNIMIHHVVLDSAMPQLKFSVPPLPEHSLFFYSADCSYAENTTTNKKERLASSTIVGPQIDRHVISTGRNHVMIKVGFQPGGLYRLLGIPMHELLCQDAFDAIDLLGNEVEEVNDRLKHTIHFAEMKMIIETFLLKRVTRLKQALPIDQVLPILLKERGLLKVDQLASQSCLSIRQFERVFRQRIGLSPKYFSRLVRFSQAWVMKEQTPTLNWTAIAYECGYFDQMHLVRDFHQFAGVNPSAISAELEQSPVKFFNRIFC